MNLLGAKLYDPAGAVSKATSSLLAMTAFDTTNLRLNVTVPAHGMLKFMLKCAVTGATTVPTVLLGVLSGATVIGRVVPQYSPSTANLATQDFMLWAEFTATGLTPGAANFDAAYGVEVVVAATNIKYGGPNDTTTNNAWGGFSFEIYDPQPQTTTAQLAVGASGVVTVGTINSNVITAASIAASALNGKGDWNIGKTGYALSAAGVQAIWDALTSALTTANSIGKLLVDNINATISSRLATSGYTAPLDAAGTRTAVGLASANLDTQLSTVDTVVDAVKVQTDKMNFTGTDIKSTLDGEAVSTTVAAADIRSAIGLASANLDTQLAAIDDAVDTEIGAIKTKTDQLSFTSGGVDSTPTATGIAGIWNALTSGMSTVGSIGKGIYDSFAQITGIKAKTDSLDSYDWDQKNNTTTRNDN